MADAACPPSASPSIRPELMVEGRRGGRGYWILASYKDSRSVTPANPGSGSGAGAGVHNHIKRLDSDVRRNNGPRQIQIFCKKIKGDIFYLIQHPKS